jgi:hypothetical protein
MAVSGDDAAGASDDDVAQVPATTAAVTSVEPLEYFTGGRSRTGLPRRTR